MSVFDDKRYDQLDWISQAVEPIESYLSTVLEKLPDSVNIDFDVWISIGSGYGGGGLTLDVEEALGFLLKKAGTLGGIKELPYNDRRLLCSCYTLECEPNTILDFDKKAMVGTVMLTKTKSTFEAEDLKALMVAKAIQAVVEMSWGGTKDLGRLGEVCEIIGTDYNTAQTRSINKRQYLVRARVEQILRDNEWNIKNVELGEKVGKWITDYVINGRLNAFTNLCKLKVMTHGGKAIYSMEEEK